jgi:hypothetical protein
VTASTVISDKPLRPDERPLAEYRSVCGTSIVAAVLGLSSAIVLVNPLLAPVPIAALVAAIIALISIAGSGGQLVGRIPAIVGLCLATFFLGWGGAGHLMRQALLEQRAKEAADGWLGLLQNGHAQQAHQFRLPPASRLSSPEALAEHYEKSKEAAEELQTFTSSTGVRDLLALGSAAVLRFEGLVTATRDGFSDILVLKYNYTRPAGEAQPIWVHVTRRYDDSTKRPEWEVGGLSMTPPPGSQ